MKRFFLAFRVLCVVAVLSFAVRDTRAGNFLVAGSPFVINGTTNLYGGSVGSVSLANFTLQVQLPYGMNGNSNQAVYTVYAGFVTNNFTNAVLIGTFQTSTNAGTYTFLPAPGPLPVQVFVGIATTNLTTNLVQIIQ